MARKKKDKIKVVKERVKTPFKEIKDGEKKGEGKKEGLESQVETKKDNKNFSEFISESNAPVLPKKEGREEEGSLEEEVTNTPESTETEEISTEDYHIIDYTPDYKSRPDSNEQISGLIQTPRGVIQETDVNQKAWQEQMQEPQIMAAEQEREYQINPPEIDSGNRTLPFMGKKEEDRV